jgi:site-specific DNA-methyltransferase (adenine-specific)
MMKPYYQDDAVQIFCGDCREIVPALGPVDAVVTDPPYGLRFMGKAWDYDVPGVDLWRVIFAALKPGGHCLAFAGTRTQHRMAVNIEDAGFEIRDMIIWCHGQGFPKNLDVSKAIDKAAGAEREVVGRAVSQGGRTGSTSSVGQHLIDAGKVFDITAPATDAAKQWQGWGTALKPAMEPITVARKPLDGTVAENVLNHGTGAINIDGCRVGGAVETWPATRSYGGGTEYAFTHTAAGVVNAQPTGNPPPGRWPANLIHDGSDKVVGLFPVTTSTAGNKSNRHCDTWEGGAFRPIGGLQGHSDSGSAARFFYCAKAARSERGGDNHHPTVKPLALMKYLIRLVLPPGGVLLDPFAGSGTTGLAAIAEGRKAILIEREERYCEIGAKRMAQEVLPLAQVTP